MTTEQVMLRDLKDSLGFNPPKYPFHTFHNSVGKEGYYLGYNYLASLYKDFWLLKSGYLIKDTQLYDTIISCLIHSSDTLLQWDVLSNAQMQKSKGTLTAFVHCCLKSPTFAQAILHRMVQTHGGEFTTLDDIRFSSNSIQSFADAFNLVKERTPRLVVLMEQTLDLIKHSLKDTKWLHYFYTM